MDNSGKAYVVIGTSEKNDTTIFSVHLDELDAQKKVNDLNAELKENKKLLETLNKAYSSSNYMMRRYLGEAINAFSRLYEYKCNSWVDITYYEIPFFDNIKSNKVDRKLRFRLDNQGTLVAKVSDYTYRISSCSSSDEFEANVEGIIKKIFLCRGDLHECLDSCNRHLNLN